MASMKYTKMWILLSEYNFHVDAQKHRDLICSICKSLLKNAQQSICGCAFCFECIKNYLATDAKYCPGRSNGCKELMSNIERNMQIDHAANKKVANVIVTCPIEFCDFKTELKSMDEHIESHDDDSGNHGKFLREPLEKLKKEISGLRDDLQLYKKDSLSKELTIMKIRDEIDCLKKTNDAVKSELNDLTVEIIKLSRRNNDNCKEIEENDDDDIDWQLEIFSGDIDVGTDFNANKKRKIQEPAVTAATERNKEVVSGRIIPTREIKELIAAEVKRNNESLRNAQIRLEEEIKLLKAKLQCQISDGKPFQLVKGEEGGDRDGASRVSAVAVEQPGKQEEQEEAGNVKSAAAAASSDGKTTRRKLRRELPQVKISPPTKNEDQASNSSKVVAQSKPSSAAGTVSKPSNSLGTSKNALKVVISSKPLHPLTLLRLNQKEKRAKMVPNSRSRAIFAMADQKKRMQRNLVGGSLGLTGSSSSSSNLTSLIEPLHWMRNISPFEFRIDNFTDKHLQSKQGFHSNIFSPPFFSAKNGYKMCLRIDFDPNRSGFSSHVGAFFCLLRGEHDDRLPWPMKLEITISIIDQITFLPYTSRTFDYGSAPEHWKYVFHRPTIMQDQLWFGTPQFVHFDFIFKNPQLLLNDSILVRCSVSS